MIFVISCEPTIVGCTIKEVKARIEFRNHRGLRINMLDKILRAMYREGLTIVPKFI